MHYADIVDEIFEKDLVDSSTANPYITGNNYLQKLIDNDQVVRISRGIYVLKENLNNCVEENKQDDNTNLDSDSISASSEDALDNPISAYGRFWERSLFEKNGSNLFGVNFQRKISVQKKRNARPVDYTNAMGIYLLHKGYNVVYVGKASTDRLAARLKEHTLDSLRNRWDSFSWFSLPQSDENSKTLEIDSNGMLSALEALLIEVLGPDRNMRQGDKFWIKEVEQISREEYYFLLSENKFNESDSIEV